MTSTRTGRTSQASGSADSYQTWPYEVELPSQFKGDVFPCTVYPKKFRVSWSFVSILETSLLSVISVIYLGLSERTLKKMLPSTDPSVSELSEWMLRLYASQIMMQITLLLCGVWLGGATARKIIYYGLLTGNVLSVAIYAAFVHSMSRWNTVNTSFVAVLSTFSLFKIVVLVLNPSWWVWNTTTLVN